MEKHLKKRMDFSFTESLEFWVLGTNSLIPQGVLLFFFLWHTSGAGNFCGEGSMLYLHLYLLFSCEHPGMGVAIERKRRGMKQQSSLIRDKPHLLLSTPPQGTSFGVRCAVSAHGPATGNLLRAPFRPQVFWSKVMTNDQEISSGAAPQPCVNFSLTPAPSVTKAACPTVFPSSHCSLLTLSSPKGFSNQRSGFSSLKYPLISFL